MRKAPFLVVEGIDGAGTTTQTRRLVAALREHNVATIETREPTDGPIGMLLRQMLKGRIVSVSGSGAPGWRELGLLFAADRVEHAVGLIEPQRCSGTWIVSDRYDYSSVAYQSASAGSMAAIPWLRELNHHAPRPDLTLVIDVSAEVARERRLSRSTSREIFDDDHFQSHLAAFYRDIERHFSEDRIVHIDGNHEADQVFAAIWQVVVPLLDQR